MPASIRHAKLAALDEPPRRRPEIIISKEQDVVFVQELVSQVTAWLAEESGAAPSRTLTLPSANSYQRAIQYQELRKDQFGAAQPPGFYIEVCLDGDCAEWALCMVLRL